MVNIKIILFLLAHFNSLFNNYFFFKFINKCKKEILRCASPSSHVCDFLKVGVTLASLITNLIKFEELKQLMATSKIS